MLKFTKTCLLVLVLLVCFCCTSFAMRCGSKLVDKGDSKFYVEESCGAPLKKETVAEERTGLNNSRKSTTSTYVTIEKWYYDLGGDVIRVITFKGDTVKRIDFIRK